MYFYVLPKCHFNFMYFGIRGKFNIVYGDVVLLSYICYVIVYNILFSPNKLLNYAINFYK